MLSESNNLADQNSDPNKSQTESSPNKSMLKIPNNAVNMYPNDQLEDSNDKDHFASNISQIENQGVVTNVEDEEE